MLAKKSDEVLAKENEIKEQKLELEKKVNIIFQRIFLERSYK
jgi:hypothetical protein